MGVFIPEKKIITDVSITETMGGPSYYVDGCKQVRSPDVMHIICYVEQFVGDRVERIEVVRLHMGHTNYADQLALSYAKLRNGSAH